MKLQVRRGIRLVAAVALGGSLVVVAPAATAQAAPADAMIRAAHFSPTTAGVDVYLSRFAGGKAPTKLWLSKVRYGAVSGYQPLTPGLYTVAMRLAGAPANSRPTLSWTLRARPGAVYTVAGVGAGTSVRGVVVRDDLSRPPSGQGRVRVIQAASRAPVADLRATTGAVISPDARFATVTKYATLPAGRWTVRASSDGSSPAVSTSGPVVVRSGQVTSILLLDAKSAGITLRTVVDSSASRVVPVDAVPAGGGGTASDFVTDSRTTSSFAVYGGLAALLSAALLSLGAFTVSRRRVRRA